MTGVVVVAEGGEHEWDPYSFVDAIRRGERFFVREGSFWLELEPVVCDRCPRVTISTLTRPRKG